MGKAICIFIIMIVSVGIFADMNFEIGPTAILDIPITVSSIPGIPDAAANIGLDDFLFGADAELTWGILQVGAMAVFQPEYDDAVYYEPAIISTLVTGGILIDLLLVRLGVSAGPAFNFVVSDEEISEPFGMDILVKANVDVALGPVALRLNVITTLDLLQMGAEDDLLQYIDLMTGISVLFSF